MTQVPKPLVGVHAKIERAKKHVSELESEIRRFIESNPYEVVRYQEPKNGDTVFRFRPRLPLPPEWSAIAGEILYDLRSSLDNLAYLLVLINRGTPNRDTGFPIYRSADEFETNFLGKVKGACDKAVTLIKGLKPYRGGNDALWQLHRLNIADKHHLPIGVGGAYKEVIIDHGLGLRETARRTGFDWADDIPSMAIGLRPAHGQFPLVEGAELYRIKAGADPKQVDMNPKFTFEIAFDEVEIAKGEPILPTLHQLVGSVEETVKLFHPLFLSTVKG